MSEDLDPDALRTRSFSTARRGFDRAEVEAFQQQVAEDLAALQGRVREMEDRIGQVGITDLPDLKREFDTVGEDVRDILQSARDAAEDMRDRAGADAAKWRADATAEVVDLNDQAQTQSEVLRRAAWEASESMLTRVVAEVDQMTAKAHEDVLFVRAEAEREALRLTGDAKRDAEELLRSARTDSEKVTLDARNEVEATVVAAQQSVEQAEDEVRTLEQRHQELLNELEATRQTLSDLEDHIEGRKASLTHATTDPTETSVRVLSDDDESAGMNNDDWLDEDSTVRLLPPPVHAAMEPVDADELAAEVESLRSLSPPIVPLEPPRHGLELVTGGSESSAEAASLDFEITSGDTPVAADASATAELAVVHEGETELESEPEPQPEVEPEPEPESDSHPQPAPEPEVVPEAASEAQQEPTAEPILANQSEPQPETEPAIEDVPPEPAPEPAPPAVDDIDNLFASLRAPQPEPEPPTAELESQAKPEPVPQDALESAAVAEAAVASDPTPEPAEPAADSGVSAVPGDSVPEDSVRVDPPAVRDRVLLPITNGALREIKRAIVEVQNAVLEELRTGADDWRPDEDMFEILIGSEASAVAANSYRAGVVAAGELTGSVAPDLPDGSNQDLSNIVTDLCAAAADAIEASAGGGNRERGASVGRVFRAWRTDEAERRVRRVAHSEYNAGVVAGLTALGISHSIEPPGKDLADADATVIPVAQPLRSE